MKIAAILCLALALLLTLFLIKADLAVPGHYTRWGQLNMTAVFTLIAARWLALTLAFILLALGHQLDGWSPGAFARFALVLGGLFFMEVASLFVHMTSVGDSIKPTVKVAYSILAPLLPLCVVASGLLASRSLFLTGVLGTVVAALTASAGGKSFALPRPLINLQADAPMESLLFQANPMYGTEHQAALWKLMDQRAGWQQEAAAFLDGGQRLAALYTLCHAPTSLDAALQERCWKVVAEESAAELKELEKQPATTARVLELMESAKALASVPGPLRDQYHAAFLEACKVVAKARAESPSIPDLAPFDWKTAPGK